jgi:hypothetical protein
MGTIDQGEAARGGEPEDLSTLPRSTETREIGATEKKETISDKLAS